MAKSVCTCVKDEAIRLWSDFIIVALFRGSWFKIAFPMADITKRHNCVFVRYWKQAVVDSSDGV